MKSLICTFFSLVVLVYADPQAVIAGFDKRVDAIFKAESGKPLKRAKKNPPLKPGRGNYTRGYSYSIVGFAVRCFYLNEKLDEANAALVENAQHYLDNPKDIHDRDSFHWHASEVMRLIETYGTKGKGTLTKETETVILKPIWIYVQKASTLAKTETEKSQTWHIWESENHHAMIITTCWHFAKLAKERTEYRTKKYSDGSTLEQQYDAWNKYIIRYCLERARKGMLIEMMCDSYNSTLIKGFYNFYDFGNPKIKKAAGQLLDLYYAYWAQEQINIVQGGGRSRVYFHKGLKQNRNHAMAPLAWIYFDMGKKPKVSGHDINPMLSAYRPPAVVADIAIDHQSRGTYEVRQRPLGVVPARGMHPYKIIPDDASLIRYSYCDPTFIMGSLIMKARPVNDWAGISSQNRWQGVIFNDDNDARIIPIVRPKDNRVAMNAQWSVQSKGSMITQKLKHHKGGSEMIVWVSKAGLSKPEITDSGVFFESKYAYAAIRVTKGQYTVLDSEALSEENKKRYQTPPAYIIVPKDDFAPVIIDVMTKQINAMKSFQQKVLKSSYKWQDDILTYKSIYGDSLTLDSNQKQIPKINGKTVNLAPSKALESPFLNADWNKGIVTISKAKRKKILDFNIK